MQKFKVLVLITSLLVSHFSYGQRRSNRGRRNRGPVVHVHHRVNGCHAGARARRHNRRARRAVGRAIRNVGRAIRHAVAAPLVRPVVVARPVVARPVPVIARPVVAAPVMVAPPTEALLRAARTGNLRELKRALRRGAFVNAVNPNGQTALHLAAKVGAKACVRRLLNAGANPYAVNYFGRTPAQVAHAHGYPGVAGMIF